MSLLIDINGWDVAPWVERFARAMPGRMIVTPQDKFKPEDVEFAAVWKHTPGSLNRFKNLKVIFSLGAGVDHVLRDANLPDVPLVRLVDADLRDRMSEWVVLHVLLHHRQQRMYDFQQYEKLWEDDRFQPAARDVRVGMMGLGVLGQDAAKKLQAIGFDVAGWSRSDKQIEGLECYAGADGLAEFLARTDILVSLLPLTPDTRGVLNRALFEQLAKDGRLGGPILLNAGRGGLQVEADIVACLDDGTLRAATLDVFEVEPLPADSPLWHHPQVTITPHNSAISEIGAVTAFIVRQIERFEAGEPLEHVVDVKRGY